MPDKNPSPAARRQNWNAPEGRELGERPWILEQSQRLEALAHLSGEVAHDVNNALQVIKGTVEILRRRLHPGDADVAGVLDMLARNSDRAASLMQRLLAFTGRLPLEPREINVNKLIAGMADRLREVAGAGVAVETVLGGGLWWIAVDPDGLQTAILSLCANGRDAMSHGGTLTIETRNVAIDKGNVVVGNAVASGEYVSIAVRDNGIGMTPEVIAKVFDPYFTTKTGLGTGLGLSQVYGFMKQSNGHIDIDSAPGRGTSETLYFPRIAVADVTEMPLESRIGETATRSGTAGNRAGLRVLVVEDESLIGLLVEDLLDQLGCRMIGLVSGVKKGLEMAGSAEIDLALLDVDLGGESVYPVAEALQARGVPFVFMSGCGGLDKPWRSRPVIQKPFELVQFRLVIESALGGTP